MPAVGDIRSADGITIEVFDGVEWLVVSDDSANKVKIAEETARGFLLQECCSKNANDFQRGCHHAASYILHRMGIKI